MEKNTFLTVFQAVREFSQQEVKRKKIEFTVGWKVI